MTSSKPYLIRAIYEWIADNGFTPYITIDTSFPRTEVPEQYIVDNTITLDISPIATQELLINNEAVTCRARFDGASRDIYIPISAVIAIYAQENNQGMAFPHEESTENDQFDEPQVPTKTTKPQLKIITGGIE